MATPAAPEEQQPVVVVGAGMSGTLMAIHLARRGFAVDLYERRGDMRRRTVDAGKSIKMTLAERGLAALREVGLAEEVMRYCIPLRGRAVHRSDGTVTYQPYGKNEHEVIYSISRTDLNVMLLDRAETYPNLRLHFQKRCTGLEKETATAIFVDEVSQAVTRVAARAVIGADGAFSIVRQLMQRGLRTDYQQDFVAWGYKELTIVAAPDGSHQMDRNALHIWPCGDHMLFALPNLDGSFSGVCILPFEGAHSFAELADDDSRVRGLFAERFGDALPLIPRLCEEMRGNQLGEFLTTRTSLWHHRGRLVLLGDACHTVIPFYGQGMNAAFEDCSVLAGCLDRHPGDWETAFAEYQALRKPHTDVLAELSKENFTELRDTARSAWLTARKRALILLNRLFPRTVVPIYTLVTHSNLPYASCVERTRRQDRLARLLGADLLVGAMTLGVLVERARTRRQVRQAARKVEVKAPRTPPAAPLPASSTES
ncbi:MAG: FAD-dependent monooxygenase [Acidobacteriota bacterium]|nr:FAD-dependent monooxygenase [Acidobacteriota bacterium]